MATLGGGRYAGACDGWPVRRICLEQDDAAPSDLTAVCAAVCTGAPDHDARDSERATGWDMASQVRSFCDMHAHVRGVRRFCSCHQHGLCDCGSAIAAHADRTGWQARQAGPCMPWRDMTLQEGLLFELDAMPGG